MRFTHGFRKKNKLVNSRLLNQIFTKNAEPVEGETYIHNRNPRNLEMMRIGYRPDGYHLEAPGRCFWHQLVIERNTRQLTAKVQHYTGKTILECSTDDWSLTKHLYRPYDMAAYINFGRIFARRCLEAGIIEMENFNEPHPGGKLEAFLRELESNGLKLTESPQYKKKYAADTVRMDKPWTILND